MPGPKGMEGTYRYRIKIKYAHVREISHCKILSTESASSNKAIRVTYQTISDRLERSQVGDLARIDDRGTNWNLWDAYIR